MLRSFQMKKFLCICLISMFCLFGCSKQQEPTYYDYWTVYGGDRDILECLRDAGVEYKVVKNEIYVDNLDEACNNCC
jgi:hypothetical protein